MTVDARARATVRRRINAGRVRLEQLLNVMTVGGAGMPLSTLATVYEAVSSEKFNYVHARLAELAPAQHFSVNMDLLLEHAAAADGRSLHVEHLHGRHDRPDTIITTISQYLDQLDPTVARRFGTALHRKDVLVTGYSARDRDIHWLFEKFPPRRLTWLVYPWGDSALSPAQLREQELSAESRRLLDNLNLSPDTDVRELRTTTEAYLDSILAAPSSRVRALRPRLTLKKPVQSRLPPGARQSYSAEPDWRRRLAVAAVFLDQGLPDAARSTLNAAVVPRSEPDGRIAVAKMRARALRRGGHPWRAMWALVRPVGGGRYLVQTKSVANEASATLGTTALYPISDLADLVLLRRAEREGRRGTAFQIATRIAQHRAAQGSLTESERRFSALSDPTVPGDVDLGTWINTLTWRADLLKVQGRVDEARALLREDLEDREYADAAQKAYVDWKLLELELVAKGPKPETVRALAALARSGRDALGRQAYCWLQLTRVGASVGTVISKPEWPAVEAIARESADTENFMHLQLAEFARSHRNFKVMRRHLRAAQRIERNRIRWRGSQTARLAAQLIEATGRGQQAGTSTARTAVRRDLVRIAQKLERIGARLPAERARANAAVAQVGGDLDSLWQIAM